MSAAYSTPLVYITGTVFFYVFLKFKRGMPAVCSMTMPLRIYMLRIYSAVILVLAIISSKMKQMIDFFCFAVVERLRAELISKYYKRPFYIFRIRKKKIQNYSRIPDPELFQNTNYSEMDTPTYQADFPS